MIQELNTTGTLTAMKLSLNSARALGAVAMLALVVGCASTPPTPPAPPPESLLQAAGFKTVVASTDKQLQEIPKLPAGQVTVMSNTGKNYFVYPDLARKQIYVGTEKEYQAYLKLRAQNNMPTASPDATYMKQDAAMQKADARDNSVYWELFPDFNGLGW
jgi:hypothetical protein